MAERREGRLARWSRLKSQGEGDAEDSEALQLEKSSTSEAVSSQLPQGVDDLPDPSMLPGGVQNRKFVAPMAPLADLEGLDNGMPAYEAPPPEALAMLRDAATSSAEGITSPKAFPEELPERELTCEETAAVRNLPPLESLSKDSDFTPFLANNIPDFIRNRALRILWRSNPFFGFQDGLDDYAENFRVIDKLIDAVTESSYRPGQGYDFPDDEDAEGEERADLKTKDENLEANNKDDTKDKSLEANNKDHTIDKLTPRIPETEVPSAEDPAIEENPFPSETDLGSQDV